MIDYEVLFAKGLPAPAARPGPLPHYNFVGGHNDPDGIPVPQLIESARRCLEAEGRTLALYNGGMGGLGYPGLRDFIAGKLRHQRGMAETAEDILVTSGSLQGLDLVNAALLEPGDTVIVENMTYSGTIDRLRALGVEVVGAPMDNDGLLMDELAAILADLKAREVRPKFIYTIPTIQNPTGSVMPLDRRKTLLALSAEYGVPVFEDECYADLVWEGDWPPSLRGLPGGDSVIHIGSFSKSLAPAFRLGYVAAPWAVTSRLLALKGDGGTPLLDQMIVADFCHRHFDGHVKALKQRLVARLKVLTDALAEEFGTAAEFVWPKGGIFLWVTLPEAVDTMALASAAAKEGIAFNPGPQWSTDEAASRHSLRLCFALAEPGLIREGIRKLAEVCHRETGVPVRSGNLERSAG